MMDKATDHNYDDCSSVSTEFYYNNKDCDSTAEYAGPINIQREEKSRSCSRINLSSNFPRKKRSPGNSRTGYANRLTEQEFEAKKKVDQTTISRILQEIRVCYNKKKKRVNVDRPVKKKRMSSSKIKNLSELTDLKQSRRIRRSYECNELKIFELKDSEKRCYECKECNKVFQDFRALGGHIASHNKKLRSMSEFYSKSEYKCNICKEVFDDFRALGGHVASHNKKKRAEEFAAWVNDFAGGEESSSLVAESDNNGREQSYECNICFKIFSSGQALGGHKTYHRKQNFAETSDVQGSSGKVICSARNPAFVFDLNLTPDDQGLGDV